jgi:hypothetical protein
MQGGQLSLIDEDVGLDGEEGMETTNMELSFPGEDANSKDAHAVASKPPRPNLKTWKRMARRGAHDEEVLVSKKKTKRVRNVSPDNMVEEVGKLRKRCKQIGDVHGGDEELMAVAVEQPRQAP